jgi:hypothetical protein
MRTPPALSTLALWAGVACVLGGCGRKATRADCELFVDRNVEVQLKNQGTHDEKVIAEKKASEREFFKAKIDECVGKRITDSMVECVKAAENTEQIDKCLR